MTICGEEMADAIQGLIGVISVQGGQYQMAGLGKGDGVLHSLWGANLADQNNVRSLTQCIL